MEQIEYTRTVVPSSMRSPYWKYFGFPSDNANNILTRQKIVCTICNTAITYNKNTSNLRTHLMSKHFDIFQGIIIGKGGTKDVMSESGFHQNIMEESFLSEAVNVNLNKRLCRETEEDIVDSFEWRSKAVSESTIIVPEASSELDKINKDPIENFCSHLQIENCDLINYGDNLNVDSDFVEVVEHSNEEINDRNFEKNISEETLFHVELNNELQEKKLTDSIELILAEMVQTDLLTLDALTRQGFNKYNQKLTGISIDGEIITKIMEIIEEKFAKTQQLINCYVADLSQIEPFSLSIEVYEDYSQDKVLNIYYNYLNVNKTELCSILYRSCTINYITPEIYDLLSDINLENCSGIVVPCLRDVHSSILDFAKTCNIPVVECFESMITYCLRKIYESCELSVDLQNLIREGRTNACSKRTLKPGCYWSKLEVLENMLKTFENHELEKWKDLQKCIDYLKPLKMASNVVADERLPSCSLIRPIITKLFEENFRQTTYQPSKIVLIQNILQKELYEKIITQKFLKEATFFDPRFHQSFVSSGTVYDLKQIKYQITQRFKSVLQIAAIKLNEKNTTKQTCTNFLENSGQSSSLKMFFKPDPFIVQNVKTDLDSELELYRTNACLDLDQSPALWWKEAKKSYKQLSKIAKFYFTVPCFYMFRLYHLDVEQRRFILEQRKHLNQLCQTESKLWYLFYNNNFIESV